MQRYTSDRYNRRAFLHVLSGSTAAAWVVPDTVFGGAGRPAPSDRITLGCIGIGMMGQGHHRRFLQTPETQVLAVCDVDSWRRDNAQRNTEQAYAAQRRSGLYRGCTAYNDLLELVDRDDIDAVVIATGDRWHATASILAAKAGKDIYCEKPMSLAIEQSRAMVRVMRRYGRVFQTGLQQRSTHEFQLACRLVREGVLGKIERVYIHFPGTSSEIELPAEPVPKGLDWDRWLGPATLASVQRAVSLLWKATSRCALGFLSRFWRWQSDQQCRTCFRCGSVGLRNG